jgi:glycosyltransferase involved in cell wall biosynthesis
MLMGTPVLVAACPATLEVCRDAAIFFDPLDQSDFVTKLKVALENEAIRQEKVGIGLKLVQRYKWSRTAEQVLAAYRTIL